MCWACLREVFTPHECEYGEFLVATLCAGKETVTKTDAEGVEHLMSHKDMSYEELDAFKSKQKGYEEAKAMKNAKPFTSERSQN